MKVVYFLSLYMISVSGSKMYCFLFFGKCKHNLISTVRAAQTDSLIFPLVLCQILWEARSLHPLTVATRSRSAARPYSRAWAFLLARCSSTPVPRAHRSSWTWPKGRSKDKPAFATLSPSATDPSPCTNRSASRWELVKCSTKLNYDTNIRTTVYQHQ